MKTGTKAALKLKGLFPSSHFSLAFSSFGLCFLLLYCLLESNQLKQTFSEIPFTIEEADQVM